MGERKKKSKEERKKEFSDLKRRFGIKERKGKQKRPCFGF